MLVFSWRSVRVVTRCRNEKPGGQGNQLQRIANKLRVPLTHLVGPKIADKPQNTTSVDDQYREIKLEQLDAAALRQLAGETDEINWFLKIDWISELLEETLLHLRQNLRVWNNNNNGRADQREGDNLFDQISRVKMSADMNERVEELAQHKLKIFGGTYVAWNKERVEVLSCLNYTSRLAMALSIEPEGKTNSTVRVFVGSEPPQQFVEGELAGIDFIMVDNQEV